MGFEWRKTEVTDIGKIFSTTVVGKTIYSRIERIEVQSHDYVGTKREFPKTFVFEGGFFWDMEFCRTLVTEESGDHNDK